MVYFISKEELLVNIFLFTQKMFNKSTSSNSIENIFQIIKIKFSKHKDNFIGFVSNLVCMHHQDSFISMIKKSK